MIGSDAVAAYLTPHALARFRARVWRSCPDPEGALRAVLAVAPTAVRRVVRRDGVACWVLRYRGVAVDGYRVDVRLLLAPPRWPGRPPVVVTVLQGRVRPGGS